MNKFKIGTIVSWGRDPTKKFEIIADSEHPYKGLDASPFYQPTPVANGCDYLLRELDTKGEFKAFQNAMEFDLVEIEE